MTNKSPQLDCARSSAGGRALFFAGDAVVSSAGGPSRKVPHGAHQLLTRLELTPTFPTPAAFSGSYRAR